MRRTRFALTEKVTMTKSVFVVALASGFLLTVLGAGAEEPASNIDVLPTLYVGKFQPVCKLAPLPQTRHCSQASYGVRRQLL
jgi:hypothetical protein